MSSTTAADDDAFAFGRLNDGDAALLSRFREWLEERRQYREINDDDEAAEAAGDRADAIEDEIYAMPASGLVGITIKGYFLAHLIRIDENKDTGESLGSITAADYHEDGTLSFNAGAKVVKSFADDAVRFVPELHPLVASIVDAPVKLPPSVSAAAKAELRARAVAMAAEYDAPLPDGDAGLIEAERRLHEWEPQRKVLDDVFEITQEIEEDIINQPGGQSLGTCIRHM